MSAHAKRLDRLESEMMPAAKPIYLFAISGDEDKAIAERFPDGVPEGLQVVVYTWARSPGMTQEQADAMRQRRNHV